MRLGIDVRKLGDGGIGEYIRETLVAAARLSPDLEIVAFGAPEQRRLLPIDRLEWVAAGAGKYSLAEHLTLPAAARGRRLDLFHAPHYVLPLGFSLPSVVTIHDTIHLALPRTLIHPLYARFMMRSACRRARKVIAVSATTARDLESRLGAPPAKIEVIWNGVAARFRRLPAADVEHALQRLGVLRPYVLFVGNYLPHKNVETLIRAWGGLAEPKPGLVLCGAGFAAARPIQQALAEVGGRERAQLIERLALDDLVALYNGAELLATTSLYEGFCLPLVEAFACGTPVLASDAGAIPEIAGDAALLVPPQRVDLITGEMYRLLVDRELRRELVEKGFRRAERFSWEEAARRTLAVYREALAG